MGIMTDIRYCYKCGAEVPTGSSFCPECGASISDFDQGAEAEYTAAPTRRVKDDLGAIPLLLLVYGIIAIIGAIFLILIGMSFNLILETLQQMVQEGAMTQDEYNDFISLFGTLTTETLMIYCTAQGVILVISGILAIISGHYAGKQENYKACMVCCAVAAIITIFIIPFDIIIGIILPVVGLIVTYMIIKDKDKFVS